MAQGRAKILYKSTLRGRKVRHPVVSGKVLKIGSAARFDGDLQYYAVDESGHGYNLSYADVRRLALPVNQWWVVVYPSQRPELKTSSALVAIMTAAKNFDAVHVDEAPFFYFPSRQDAKSFADVIDDYIRSHGIRDTEGQIAARPVLPTTARRLGLIMENPPMKKVNYWVDKWTGRVYTRPLKTKPSYSAGPFKSVEEAERSQSNEFWWAIGHQGGYVPSTPAARRAYARGEAERKQHEEYIGRHYRLNPKKRRPSKSSKHKYARRRKAPAKRRRATRR